MFSECTQRGTVTVHPNPVLQKPDFPQRRASKEKEAKVQDNTI